LKKLGYYIFCLLSLIIHKNWAQEFPPFKNFLPQQYSAENQNWDISQGENEHLYFGNNSGLLEYNGAQWSLYPSPNQTIIRSVKVVGKRIYTGCYMDFGYWQRADTGLLEYTSLSANMPQPLVEDEHFWRILALKEWVIFQSLDRIYLYSTQKNTFKIIEVGAPLTKSFNLNGIIYFQALGKGLFKIVNGNVLLVSKDALLQEDVLINMAQTENSITLITQTRGIFRLSDDGLYQAEISANTVLKGSSIYSSIVLRDGRIAIGTISNGFYLLNKEGEIVQNLTQQEGLANNTVLSIYEDMAGNIWLGLDNGISVINLNSAFKVYQDTSGTLGTVYCSAIDSGIIYLGTNQGLFYKKKDTQDKFIKVLGTSGQIWSLKKIKGTLFAGHNQGTFMVENKVAVWLSRGQGTWDIKEIPENNDHLLQGNYDGLYVLERDNKKWKVRNKILGFDMSSRFFEIAAPGRILVSHEYKGVFLLNIDKNFEQVLDYRSLEKAPASLKSSLSSFGNAIFYAYKKGVLSYTVDEGFVPDTIFKKAMGEDSLYVSGKLVPDPDNNRLWGFAKNGLVYFSKGNLDNRLEAGHVSFPANLRKDMRGFENISALGSGKYLLGGVGGYITIDLEKIQQEVYTIELNAVKSSGLEMKVNYLSLTGRPTFGAKSNTIGFSYNVPVFDKYKAVDYQYRLQGLYEQWSDGDEKEEVLFENLPYGSYKFEVRAKVGNQLTQNAASYSFEISKPWYLTTTFIVVYIILAGFILVLFHFYNRGHYRKKTVQLEEENKRKLALHTSENEKEVMRLRNEKLEDDFKSKSRELAASAMSIVKKNELLTAIKKELQPIKEEEHVKKVIRTLDKNLNTTKDWKFFEEAFTNADKEFFNKIKDQHPKLTTKDLKLCAYLRLNLASKEIAPLLNISVRSVEIKRYRLRKKLDLDHEKSLVEYIMII